MDKWEIKFRESLVGMGKPDLTKTINHCFSMANHLSREPFNLSKGHEKSLWKKKAKVAIEVRSGL